MNDLTEQQIEDLFKDAPKGYNYYMPDGKKWYPTWFMVENDEATKKMNIDSKREYSCSNSLEALLEDGAIKRPEPKEEAKMIYTQEMQDNGVLPSVGMDVVVRYNFDSKRVIQQGEVLYISKRHVILNTINNNEWHGLLGDYAIELLPPVKTELEIAQEKQVADIIDLLEEDASSNYEVIVKLLQEKGMLAKIITKGEV